MCIPYGGSKAHLRLTLLKDGNKSQSSLTSTYPPYSLTLLKTLNHDLDHIWGSATQDGSRSLPSDVTQASLLCAPPLSTITYNSKNVITGVAR